jgi:hypothetical protein
LPALFSCAAVVRIGSPRQSESSTLLQGHTQPAALHVEDAFQVCLVVTALT